MQTTPHSPTLDVFGDNPVRLWLQEPSAELQLIVQCGFICLMAQVAGALYHCGPCSMQEFHGPNPCFACLSFTYRGIGYKIICTPACTQANRLAKSLLWEAQGLLPILSQHEQLCLFCPVGIIKYSLSTLSKQQGGKNRSNVKKSTQIN